MEEKKEFNVDEGLKKLEEINRKLSEKDITLEESLKLYNEGVKLAQACRENLEGVEKELKIINDSIGED